MIVENLNVNNCLRCIVTLSFVLKSENSSKPSNQKIKAKMTVKQTTADTIMTINPIRNVLYNANTIL